MNPSAPSRTAVLIARQRAAHQLLDHGPILNDPFALKLLYEDENNVTAARSPGCGKCYVRRSGNLGKPGNLGNLGKPGETWKPGDRKPGKPGETWETWGQETWGQTGSSRSITTCVIMLLIGMRR